MVFPLEQLLIIAVKLRYIHGSFCMFFILPKMEAPHFESIFECISSGANTVIVIVLVLVLVDKIRWWHDL